MIKNKLQQILNDSKVQQKLKQLGENPDNLKASKDSLVIIYDDKTYEIKMINTLTRKHKDGPKEPRTSKLDLILKRLDTMDNRFDKIEHRLDKVDTFITEQRKFNTKVDSFITKQEEFNAEQRKFNAKQEKFNNWVVDVFNKNNLKV